MRKGVVAVGPGIQGSRSPSSKPIERGGGPPLKSCWAPIRGETRKRVLGIVWGLPRLFPRPAAETAAGCTSSVLVQALLALVLLGSTSAAVPCPLSFFGALLTFAAADEIRIVCLGVCYPFPCLVRWPDGGFVGLDVLNCCYRLMESVPDA